MRNRRITCAIVLGLVMTLFAAVVPSFADGNLVAVYTTFMPKSGQMSMEVDARDFIEEESNPGMAVDVSVLTGATYQWYKSDDEISGATEPVYTINFNDGDSYKDIYWCKVLLNEQEYDVKVYLLAQCERIVDMDEAGMFKLRFEPDEDELVYYAKPYDSLTLTLNAEWFTVYKDSGTSFSEASTEETANVVENRATCDWYKYTYDASGTPDGTGPEYVISSVSTSDFSKKYYAQLNIQTTSQGGHDNYSVAEYSIQTSFPVIDSNLIVEAYNCGSNYYAVRNGDKQTMTFVPGVEAFKYSNGEWVEIKDTSAYEKALTYKWYRAGDMSKVIGTSASYSVTAGSDTFGEYICNAYYKNVEVGSDYYTLDEVFYHDTEDGYRVEVQGNEQKNILKEGDTAELDVLADYGIENAYEHMITVWNKGTSEDPDNWTQMSLNSFKDNLTFQWFKHTDDQSTDQQLTDKVAVSSYTAQYSDVDSLIYCNVYYNDTLVGPCNFDIGDNYEFDAGEDVYEMIEQGTTKSMTATYTTNVEGGTVTYQWYKSLNGLDDSEKIEGATSATYRTSVEENTIFYCVMDYAVEDEHLFAIQNFAYDVYVVVDRELKEDGDPAVIENVQNNVFYRYTFKPKKSQKYTFYSENSKGSPYCFVESDNDNDYDDWKYSGDDTENTFSVLINLSEDTAFENHKYYVYVGESSDAKDYELKIYASSNVMEVVRLFGSDRYYTGQAVVNYAVDNVGLKTDVVFLVSGEAFPDALASTPLASYYDAPIVMTSSKSLAPQAKQLLEKYKPKKIIAIGDTPSISENTLSAAVTAAGGAESQRIYGSDRFATALAIYNEGLRLGAWGDTCILASGLGFADALSISPYAYSEQIPIILIDSSATLSAQEVDAIGDGDIEKLILLGDSKRVLDSVANQVDIKSSKVIRLGGADRYATSMEVVNWCIGNSRGKNFQPIHKLNVKNGIGFASGLGFPDALSAGPLLGKLRAPILLVSDSSATTAASFVSSNSANIISMYFYGGLPSISDSTAKTIIHSKKYDVLDWLPESVTRYNGIKPRNK